MRAATTDQIRRAIAAAEPLLSDPSVFADTGVHHGYRQVSIATGGGGCRVAEFQALLDLFDAPVHTAWLSWIEPGGYIRRHVDAGPHRERWQIPMTVDGYLADDNGPVPHRVGVPFQVHHHEWHHVSNPGPGPRISLVVDLDRFVTHERSPLKVGDPDGN